MTGPSVDEVPLGADDAAPPPRRGARRVVAAAAVLVLVAGALVVATNVVLSQMKGCCGQEIQYGEIFYCVQPDAAHAVGDTYLLRTVQRIGQQTQTKQWPDRIETGRVGTPLLWRQPVGDVALSLNYDPSGPNDTTVDTTQLATVREGAVTPVVVAGGAGATTACPAPPTAVSTPQG